MSPRLIALPCCALLAACASAGGDFPSLAIRDAERISGTMEPAEGEPYVAPATPAAVLAGLDSLTGDAAAAHTAFLAKAGTVTRTVSAARGSGPGSDAWALAQIALAELESERSRAMIALADLDRLYVAAATDGSTLDQIAAARAEVERMVAAETETVDQLLGMISP